MYRITIDRSLCSGFGSCAELAPEIFELDGEGLASVRVGTSDDVRSARKPREGDERIGGVAHRKIGRPVTHGDDRRLQVQRRHDLSLAVAARERRLRVVSQIRARAVELDRYGVKILRRHTQVSGEGQQGLS